MVLASVVQYESKTKLIVDKGGGEIVTVDFLSPVDNPPKSGDIVALNDIGYQGREVAVSVRDGFNEGVATEGEFLAYSRDSNRAPIARIHLHDDGTVEVNNEGGASVSLAPSGQVDISANGAATAQLAPSGQIDLANSGGAAISMLPSGTINLNGVTIDVAGNVIGPGVIAAVTAVSAPTVSANAVSGSVSVTAAGVNMAGHVHPYTDDGSPSLTGPAQ